MLFSCLENASSKKEVYQASTGGFSVYQKHCNPCHGNDGKKGIGGAKDLSSSVLAERQAVETISHGKGAMPGYGSVLTKEEIQNVAQYVIKLRNKPTTKATDY